MNFAKMKLKTKLGVVFATILVLLAVVAFIGMYRINNLDKKIAVITNQRVLQLKLSYELMKQYDASMQAARNICLTSSDAENKKQKDIYTKNKAAMADTLQKLDKTITTEKGKELLSGVTNIEKTIWPMMDKVIELGSANKNTEAGDILMTQVAPVQDKLLAAMDAFAQFVQYAVEKNSKDANTEAQAGSWFIIVIGVIALIYGIITAIWLTRSITGNISRVATGLTDASDQVASASAQVASSSQSLAEGTSEQAASLEETSSSLEEMSSMTKQNADNASQAKALMSEVRQIVEKVDGQMKTMAEAIQEVTKTSEETGKIIKTIDEIAFQTNLLALNAAVEAARAGEAGAGFAVVADEVRNLAMRAAEAAKNTSTLIENTISTVKKSRDLTEQTKEAFGENVVISTKIGSLIDEIEAASQEQAKGISQVSIAVAEMDKVVQASAANAEESASASEEMSAQAVQMKDYVGDLVAVIEGAGSQAKQPAAAIQERSLTIRAASQAPAKAKRGQLRTIAPKSKAKAKSISPQHQLPLSEEEENSRHNDSFRNF